jgi:hypothetical protein
MKKQCTILFALLCITGAISAQSAPPETNTLFERLGGTPGITAIVDDVIDAHMNNPAINARFLPTRTSRNALPGSGSIPSIFSVPEAGGRWNTKAGIW